MGGGVPLHRGRRLLDEVGEGRVSRQWRRDPPPDPISLRRRRDTGICLDERWRMPAGLRTLGGQGSRDGLVPAEGYKEDARSRLRHEMHRVNRRSSEPVAQFGQRRSKGREILSFVGRQTSVDIFKNDRARRAAFLRQAPDQFPKGPERAGSGRDLVALPTQSTIASGERQVLARKGRPSEIDRTGRKGRKRETCNILMLYASRPPVRRAPRRLRQKIRDRCAWACPRLIPATRLSWTTPTRNRTRPSHSSHVWTVSTRQLCSIIGRSFSVCSA